MQEHPEKSKAQTPSNQPHSRSPLLEIARNFDVPVDRLFAAFKTPEALKAWWWPQNLHADKIELDFREGGHYFINMKGGPKGGGGMTGTFEEIVPNRRIRMTDRFADEHGRAISAKEANMPGEWPDEIHITLAFESSGASGSRLQLSQTGIPGEVHKDCVQGWLQSFDKLATYLHRR